MKYGPKPELRRDAKANSLKWLIQEYKSSAAFRGLAPSTRKVRAGILDELSAKYGDYPYADLNHRAVLKIRDQKANAPEAANAVIKAIRQIYKFALEYRYERIKADPTRDVDYLRSKNPDGFHAWTEDEVRQYERVHPVGTKARLAFALMMYAGCARRSDAIALGRQHLTKDGRLQYRQHKGRTKKPVHIDLKVVSELKEIVDATPTGDLTFLVTAFGRPFTSNGFGNWFKKRCKEAGLPHCSAHGLRKAAAARLAELGCSDLEIMASGGWQTLKEVQRYTKGARKRVLSDNAMDRVQADIDGTKVSNFSRDAS